MAAAKPKARSPDSRSRLTSPTLPPGRNQHAVQTDVNGIYAFRNWWPSNAAGYTRTEPSASAWLDGRDTLGMVNGVSTGSAAVNDFSSPPVSRRGGSVRRTDQPSF